jgi:toxin ParE1/3/4
MIPVRFHPDADAEMVEAALFYEAQQQDLGKRFLSVVQDSLTHIQINPTLYPVIHLDVRRCITRTFPFNVLFRITSQQIVIVAVMHQRKHPDYWKKR